MRFVKSALALSLSFGTLALSGCAGAPPVRPHVLDTQLGEMREYEFTSQYDLRGPTAVHEMEWSRDSYGNGFICFPMGEARRFRDWALKQQCNKDTK